MHVNGLSANTFSVFGKNRQPGSKPVFFLLMYRCLEMAWGEEKDTLMERLGESRPTAVWLKVSRLHEF